MGRPKALDRKQQLLDQILEHLRNRTLASVTFRTLADALGVSSYVLVYQFGNREALIGDIVREVDYRILNLGLEEEMDVDFSVFEKLTNGTVREMMTGASRHYLRLQTEAAAMDVVAENPTNAMGRYLDMWADFVTEYFEGLKYASETARCLADGYINELSGIRFRFILTGEEEVASRQLRDAVGRLRSSMLARSSDTSLSGDELFTTKVKIKPMAQALAVENRPNPAR